jgi:hypothetical protein
MILAYLHPLSIFIIKSLFFIYYLPFTCKLSRLACFTPLFFCLVAVLLPPCGVVSPPFENDKLIIEQNNKLFL